jgi:hypothetical protein
MNTNIFEAATRQKLRFSSNRGGQVGVEDLWDLSLEELDTIAKAINKQVKESSEESFIYKQSTSDKKLKLRLDVVVSVINTKLEEDEKRKAASERKAKRNQILELMSQKENEALGKKSLAALKADLQKLEELEEIES